MRRETDTMRDNIRDELCSVVRRVSLDVELVAAGWRLEQAVWTGVRCAAEPKIALSRLRLEIREEVELSLTGGDE